jgi:hypothetical protein
LEKGVVGFASQCSLGVLCASVVDKLAESDHHRDTENTEETQRKINYVVKKGVLGVLFAPEWLLARSFAKAGSG